MGKFGEVQGQTPGETQASSGKLGEARAGMSKELGKALEVHRSAIHTCFIRVLLRFLNMAPFLALIYMTWRTRNHFLLLFTMVGDRTSHFCCYLLHLVRKGFIFVLFATV